MLIDDVDISVLLRDAKPVGDALDDVQRRWSLFSVQLNRPPIGEDCVFDEYQRYAKEANRILGNDW